MDINRIKSDWILRANILSPGCTGLTLPTPWGCYVIVASWLSAEQQAVVLRHESAHCEQIARDGALRWLLRYAWQWVVVGYKSIDYEVEARRQAGQE